MFLVCHNIYQWLLPRLAKIDSVCVCSCMQCDVHLCEARKYDFPFNILSRFMVRIFLNDSKQSVFRCRQLNVQNTLHTFRQYQLCMCDKVAYVMATGNWVASTRKCGRKLLTNVNYNWLCLWNWMAEKSFETFRYLFEMQKLDYVKWPTTTHIPPGENDKEWLKTRRPTNLYNIACAFSYSASKKFGAT